MNYFIICTLSVTYYRIQTSHTIELSKTLELDVLALLINEIREQFEPIEIETRGVNTALIRELQASIYDFREKEQIYTPKQMEKFKLDYQKKMAKQFTRGYDRVLKGFKVPYESGIIRKAT